MDHVRLQLMQNVTMLLAFAAVASLGWAAGEHHGTGLVVSVDLAHQTVVVSHDAIPGFMDAMVMPWHVDQREVVNRLRPGMMIDFTVVVTATSSSLSDIHVRAYRSLERDPEQNTRLAILDAAMGKKTAAPVLAIGAVVPDFTLTDQSNRRVSLSQFRGEVIAVTFIYTRCPLPDYCLRMSTNFSRLRNRFGERLGRDLVLLSITFDPDHDRPEVLAKYASEWKADGDGWRFLTGSPDEIKRICGLFGMSFWPDEGLLTHSLHTAIIDREGRLVANIEGNQFTARQLGDLVSATLAGKQREN